MKIYNPKGKILDGDCVVGLCYGTSLGDESVNKKLADQMLHLSAGRPTIADPPIVHSFKNGDKLFTHTIDSLDTNKIIGRSGTWGSLLKVKQYLDDHHLKKPILVAQAYHVNRAARQAQKLGITVIIPKNLPVAFDRQSEQFWTRSLYYWIPFNILGSILLKWRREL